MIDTRALMSAVVAAAEAVLPLVVPGSGPAIEAGKRIIALIDQTKESLPDEDHHDLDHSREDIEERINAHVDSTVATLRGEA